MPLLEYKCKNCGKIFDELVKKYDDDVFCPDCNQKAERNYSGQMYTQTGKQTKKCTGNCKNCSGCG